MNMIILIVLPIITTVASHYLIKYLDRDK